MTHYVCGFLFSKDKKNVVLIRKNKPDWQKGKLNGVGGKIEDNEWGTDAMVREFKEEAGIEVMSWRYFAHIKVANEYKVFFFRAKADLSEVRSMEDEKIEIVRVEDIPSLKTVENLNWLIPMALNSNIKNATVIEERRSK